MKRNLRWSRIESSTASFTRAVDERGAWSITDMKPIASFGPHTSTSFSPITISITPNCTMYMQLPGSPLLNTVLPGGNVTFTPAFLANVRMSISLIDLPGASSLPDPTWSQRRWPKRPGLKDVGPEWRTFGVSYKRAQQIALTVI